MIWSLGGHLDFDKLCVFLTSGQGVRFDVRSAEPARNMAPKAQPPPHHTWPRDFLALSEPPLAQSLLCLRQSATRFNTAATRSSPLASARFVLILHLALSFVCSLLKTVLRNPRIDAVLQRPTSSVPYVPNINHGALNPLHYQNQRSPMTSISHRAQRMLPNVGNAMKKLTLLGLKIKNLPLAPI
jgi:hypothetical protein